VKVTCDIILLSSILLEGHFLDLACNSIEMTGRRHETVSDVDMQIYTSELKKFSWH
jgi:hypothetical protein